MGKQEDGEDLPTNCALLYIQEADNSKEDVPGVKNVICMDCSVLLGTSHERDALKELSRANISLLADQIFGH